MEYGYAQQYIDEAAARRNSEKRIAGRAKTGARRPKTKLTVNTAAKVPSRARCSMSRVLQYVGAFACLINHDTYKVRNVYVFL